MTLECSLVLPSLVSTISSSAAIFESKEQVKGAVKKNNIAHPLKPFLNPHLERSASVICVIKFIIITNMPTLDVEAIIPTASDRHLTKCLSTTKIEQWYDALEPNPASIENNTKKSQKLSTNELAHKLVESRRVPQMAVVLNPKRLATRVTITPNM